MTTVAALFDLCYAEFIKQNQEPFRTARLALKSRGKGMVTNMRFSKFLKNMNRGIALLIIAAVGFGCYVAYDYASFKKEKPEIEALLKEYTQKTADFVLLPEGERNFKNVSAEAVNAKTEENNKIIDSYWTVNNSKNQFYTNKEEVKSDYQEVLLRAVSKNDAENGLYQKAELLIDEMEGIKKTSPNTAEARVTFMVSYEYQGNPYEYVSWLGPINDQPVTDDNVRSCKFTDVTIAYGLTKTKDGWKISWASGWSYSKSTPEIVGEGDDNGSSITD